MAGIEHVIDRLLRDIEHGRFERSLSGLTAVSAALTTTEIYVEHYKASFGNKWMWSPILVTPPVVAARRDLLQALGQDGAAGHRRPLRPQRPAR